MQQCTDDLLRTVESTAAWLKRLNDTLARTRPSPGTWSIQEILGHLIDSAANNHQRFIRAQVQPPLEFPGYEQDAWVGAQEYQAAPWLELIEFWLLFNRHLARVMRGVPEEQRGTECRIGNHAPVTLQWLMEDYVAHLQHHTQQMRERAAALISHREPD